MKHILVYPASDGNAIAYAAEYLSKYNIPLIENPNPEVTHLLLDVPTKTIPDELLDQLPESITIAGGNLTHPKLNRYSKIDLLQNEDYLAKNAAITADCAVRVAGTHIETVFADTTALVIGWGRIGKCLAYRLRNLGCPVTVAARKESDRAILQALGYNAANPTVANSDAQFGIIFNTVPSMTGLSKCPGTLKIDLASSPGLDGEDVIWARGLPGKYAPDSSGKLIAETFLKLCQEGTS